MQIYLITIMSGFAVFLLFINILAFIFRDEQRIKTRLSSISGEAIKEEDERLRDPFLKRILKPMFDRMGRNIMRLAPSELVISLENKVTLAGKPFKFSAVQWISIQLIAAIGLPIITILFSAGKRGNFQSMFLTITGEVMLGILLPNLILSTKIKKRQKEILKVLPDVMDLLTVSVEAGLSFDGALSKVVEKMPGELSREFDIVLQEIKVGKSKKESMNEMAERVGVQDLKNFTSAVVQAEQLGVSIGNVLRIQAEQIRFNRKQRIQEKAMKASVKMLIPMILFIFPSIFIVLLGPVVLKLMKVFIPS